MWYYMGVPRKTAGRTVTGGLVENSREAVRVDGEGGNLKNGGLHPSITYTKNSDRMENAEDRHAHMMLHMDV